MPKNQIIIGIPAYGITFTLMNSSNHGFHAPVSGPGTPGKVLYTTGYYSYTEVREVRLPVQINIEFSLGGIKYTPSKQFKLV